VPVSVYASVNVTLCQCQCAWLYS